MDGRGGMTSLTRNFGRARRDANGLSRLKPAGRNRWNDTAVAVIRRVKAVGNGSKHWHCSGHYRAQWQGWERSLALAQALAQALGRRGVRLVRVVQSIDIQ